MLNTLATYGFVVNINPLDRSDEIIKVGFKKVSLEEIRGLYTVARYLNTECDLDLSLTSFRSPQKVFVADFAETSKPCTGYFVLRSGGNYLARLEDKNLLEKIANIFEGNLLEKTEWKK